MKGFLDTVAAVSTPRGKGGVAVIRVGESIVMTCSASPGSNDMTLNGTFAAT